MHINRPLAIPNLGLLGDSYYNRLSPRIVVIGGGTGTFGVLSGLKDLVGDGLTGIPSMADDGNSTGVLRYRFGTLPAGDVRQCLVALSNNPLSSAAFDKRWSKEMGFGEDEHAFGNIIIQMLQNVGGNFEEAIIEASRILQITGRVIPATLDNRHLVVTPKSGRSIIGEHLIGETVISLKGARVGFDKESTNINPRAADAVESAELIVIAPGSQITSRSPALVVNGMKEALIAARKNGAIIVDVINLMQDNHTAEFDAADHSLELERIVGTNFIDYLLFNTKKPSETDLANYKVKNEVLIPINLSRLRKLKGIQAVGAPMLANGSAPKTEKGSLVRHDPVKLSWAIMNIYHTVMAQHFMDKAQLHNL